MTDSRAAVGLDRLPWLADEPKAKAKAAGNTRELAGWAAAAALALAGGGYWLGTQSGRGEPDQIQTVTPARPSATAKLPEPRTVTPEVPLATPPEVRPAPMATVNIPEPSVERSVRRSSPARTARRRLSPMELKGSDLSKTVQEQEGTADQGATTKAAEGKLAQGAAPVVRPIPAARPPARAQQLRLWPSRQARGASGRLVQIGAFGSRQQAKLGWRRMTRAYPAVGRLPAVVVQTRNSRGRHFYRFQIGTTSQAHSEVLCQRMARIRFSCAVVGLPWKSKVER